MKSFLIKKFIFLVALISFFIFLILLILGLQWGIFASIDSSISKFDRAVFLTVNEITTYYKVQSQIDSVEKYLPTNVLSTCRSAIIIWDEPYFSALDTLKVLGGVIMDSISFEIDSRYNTFILDSGVILLSSVDTHPQIAPLKIYPGIFDWLQFNNYERDTNRAIIQINRDDEGLDVFYPIIPVSQVMNE